MVEEEDLKLGALALSPATLFERSLVDHLSLLVAQAEILCEGKRQERTRHTQAKANARRPRRS